MDNRVGVPMTERRQRLPVTLALAFALDDLGDLFTAGKDILAQAERGSTLHPLAALLTDVLSPLSEIGAFYSDEAGRHKIDRQAVLDFAVIVCGVSRHEALFDLDVQDLALFWRRRATGRPIGSPSAPFLAEMQNRFPDVKEKDHDNTSTR